MKIRTGNKKSHGVRCYASGGRVPEDISDAGSLPNVTGSEPESDDLGVDGERAKPRLDRGGKKAATTNVNIIVTSGKSEPQAPGLPPMMPKPPMPGPAMAAPMPPPGAPPMPMRKHGGRVMHAGSGGGLGRLEKIKDYGSNAGKPAKGK